MSSLKVAFDIGGVISKYPDQFRQIIESLSLNNNIEVHVITDQHDRDYTLQQLKDNGFDIPSDRVHNSDYEKYGEMCKAIVMKDNQIDMLVDDFPGYMTWDYNYGPAPIRLQIQPDPYLPYWSSKWKTRPDDGEFGRRFAPKFEFKRIENG